MCVCLQRMGVLHTGQQIEDQSDFESKFKNGGLSLTQLSVVSFDMITCHTYILGPVSSMSLSVLHSVTCSLGRQC